MVSIIQQLKDELLVPGLTLGEKAVIREQIAIYLAQLGPDLMVQFLSTHVNAEPEDPYNAYFLYRIARDYQNRDFPELALQYYARAYYQHPDLLWQNESIHFTSLQNMVELSADPASRVRYLRELINAYPEKIDRGLSQFRLAESLEDLGEYAQAVRAYEEYLRYPNTVVPGKPEIRQQIREKLAFHYSSKNWMRPTLDSLVQQMQNAMSAKNGRALTDLQAKVNFFAKSWIQDRYDVNSFPNLNLLAFLNNDSRIQYTSRPEMGADGREAYLRTSGWSPRIPTWYLYFRQVDYPADPTINGSWEWAGIYLGELL